MKPRGSRSASNNSCPLTSRRKRTLSLTPADGQGRTWLPGGQLPRLLLPLLLCALQMPTGSTEGVIKVDLDLAPQSFDDQYQGCSAQVMEVLNRGDYFTKEVDAHKNYSRVWQNAHLAWLAQAKPLPKHMTTAHAVAILVYTSSPGVRSDLSRAMAGAARSPEQYGQSFHFKYLHYYLTSAIQLLRKENGERCHEVVHHGAGDALLDARVSTTIRFGHFLSAPLRGDEVEKSGNQTVLAIETCLGAPVRDFSLEGQVVIPPYELFEVVSQRDHPTGQRLYLRSSGNQSAYNCQLLKASSKRRTPAPALIVSLAFLASVVASKSRVQRNPAAPV